MPYKIYSISRQNGRKENQDFCFYKTYNYDNKKKITILGISDGMGGLEGGKKISQMTIYLVEYFINSNIVSKIVEKKEFCYKDLDFKEILENAVEQTNNAICEYKIENGINGGATLTLVCIMHPVMYILGVGDSPCYLVNTMDSNISLMQEVENNGYWCLKNHIYTDKKSIEFRREASKLLNYIGSPQLRIQEMKICNLPMGYDLVMGSDGAFGDWDEEQICSALEKVELEEDLEKMLEEIREDGETDNQTLLLYKYYL